MTILLNGQEQTFAPPNSTVEDVVTLAVVLPFHKGSSRTESYGHSPSAVGLKLQFV